MKDVKVSPVDLRTLSILSERGVEFCISVPNQYGQEIYVATAEDLMTFLEDPTAVYAKALGVTKEQYRDWMDDSCIAYCSAKTRAGRQCRNAVAGGFQVSAARWVALQGEYCMLHAEGGGGMLRAVVSHK